MHWSEINRWSLGSGHSNFVVYGLWNKFLSIFPSNVLTELIGHCFWRIFFCKFSSNLVVSLRSSWGVTSPFRLRIHRDFDNLFDKQWRRYRRLVVFICCLESVCFSLTKYDQKLITKSDRVKCSFCAELLYVTHGALNECIWRCFALFNPLTHKRCGLHLRHSAAASCTFFFCLSQQ